MVSVSGQLELGAELEVDHDEVEGENSTEESVAMDTNTDIDITHIEGTDTIQIAINHALSKLSEDGCIYTKDVVSMINDPTAKTLKLFHKELDKATQHNGYKNYSTNRKLGKVIYDPLRFSDHAIMYTYKLHVSKWQQQNQISDTMSEEHIRKLIVKQCSNLPCAATYDYRSLIHNKGILEEAALDQHFNTELSGFVERISTSNTSKQHTTTGSESYRNLRKLRI